MSFIIAALFAALAPSQPPPQVDLPAMDSLLSQRGFHPSPSRNIAGRELNATKALSDSESLEYAATTYRNGKITGITVTSFLRLKDKGTWNSIRKRYLQSRLPAILENEWIFERDARWQHLVERMRPQSESLPKLGAGPTEWNSDYIRYVLLDSDSLAEGHQVRFMFSIRGRALESIRLMKALDKTTLQERMDGRISDSLITQ